MCSASPWDIVAQITVGRSRDKYHLATWNGMESLLDVPDYDVAI